MWGAELSPLRHFGVRFPIVATGFSAADLSDMLAALPLRKRAAHRRPPRDEPPILRLPEAIRDAIEFLCIPGAVGFSCRKRRAGYSSGRHRNRPTRPMELSAEQQLPLFIPVKR